MMREMRMRSLRWLDKVIKPWTAEPRRPLVETPGGSWLRLIRIALGLSTRRLAARVGVSDAAVRSAERAEAEGGISLATLQRYAAGLDCDVIYRLVPRSGSLRTALEDRAEAVQRARFARRRVDPEEIRRVRHWTLSRNLSALWKGGTPGC